MKNSIFILVIIFLFSCSTMITYDKKENYNESEFLNEYFVEYIYKIVGTDVNIIYLADSLYIFDVKKINELYSDCKRIIKDNSFYSTLDNLNKLDLKYIPIDIKKLTNDRFFEIYSYDGNRENKFSPLKRIAIVKISRPVFNNDSTKFLFYSMMDCGTLCGSDDIVIFKKINSKWKFYKLINLAIS